MQNEKDAMRTARRRTASPTTSTRLRLSYHPLDYIELIVWFAFEEKVFLIIFFIAGFLTILISVILWTSVRLNNDVRKSASSAHLVDIAVDCRAAVPGRASRRPVAFKIEEPKHPRPS